MSVLPSWLLRETARNDRHSHVSVFVGPDRDHRAHAGSLVLDHDQADDLFEVMGIRRWRVDVERADGQNFAPTPTPMRAQFTCPLEGDGCEAIAEVEYSGSPIDSPTCPEHHVAMLLAGFREEGR